MKVDVCCETIGSGSRGISSPAEAVSIVIWLVDFAF